MNKETAFDLKHYADAYISMMENAINLYPTDPVGQRRCFEYARRYLNTLEEITCVLEEENEKKF